jgi:hypothetical protein
LVLETAEVRWFFEGTTPSALRAWFLGLDGDLNAEAPRTDHYLLIQQTDALGIKFREGRIEVKQRSRSPERSAFGQDQSGSLEHWRKWGFPLASVGEHQASLETLDAWIAVTKTRWVRDYRIGPLGTLLPLERPDLSIAACSVELADVQALDTDAWTLAFEATGPAVTLAATLENVARQILNSLEDRSLVAKNSYGYPRWLQRLHS